MTGMITDNAPVNGGRVLWSAAAEQSVIGAILLDNRAYDAVVDTIREADFFTHAHRRIYRTAAALIEAGKQADVVTVFEAMQRGGDAEPDTLSYLNALATNTPGASGARHYAQVVRDRSIERAIIATGMEMADIAGSPEPVVAKLERVTQVLYSLTEASVTEDPEPVAAYLAGVKTTLQARIERGGATVGLATGIVDLDAQTAGMHAGQLIIVGGRPAMGKTGVGIQIAMTAGLGGGTVLAFEMEMSRAELIERMLSNLSGVDGTHLRSGRLDDREIARIESAEERLRSARIVIDDLPARSPSQIRARARRVKRRHGLSLIVVDHIGLVRGIGDRRYEQIGDVTRSLKALAKELEVPVLALCQINRGTDVRDNRRPKLSDLRESGDIEQDADVVLLLYRDEYYDPHTEDPGVIEISIAKQRNGPTGTVRARWEGPFTRVADLNPGYRPPRVPRRPPVGAEGFPE